MVGGDQINYALAKCLPEIFAILAAADGRRAFVLCAAVGNIFRGEVQLMRASLHSERHARISSGVQGRQGAAG